MVSTSMHPTVHMKPFEIRGSDNITIRNGDMEGVASGTGQGRGIWVGDSSDFKLRFMTIHGFETAIFAVGVDKLTIRDNTIRNIATDGIIAGGIGNGVISDNSITLNAPKGRKHSDGIQFWNNKPNDPSHDLKIEGNEIRTQNNDSHGIYMANAVANGGGGPSSFFQNVTIHGNRVISGDGFGITWGQTNHLDIDENIVIRDNQLAGKGTPSIRVVWQSSDVGITHNVVEKASMPTNSAWFDVNKRGSNWTISDKIIPLGSTLAEANAAMAKLQGAPEAAPQAAQAAVSEADTFRFDAKGAPDRVSGVDFDRGDTVVLHDYAKGTFAGGSALGASADGTSVTVDGLSELRALDKASSAVKVHAGSDDTIVIDIHQGGSQHTVLLAGLAHEYF